MKKLYTISMLVAAAAMAFTACSKDELEGYNPENEVKTVEREFIVDFAQTRTQFNDDATKLQWSDGDKFYVITTGGETTALLDNSTAVNAPTNGGSVAVTLNENANTVYAFYPQINKLTNAIESDSKLNVELFVSPSQIQKKAGEFYGAMMPIWAKGTIATEGTTTLTFNPAASILAVNIYGMEGEKVSYVKFKPASGTLNGKFTYNVLTDTPTASIAVRKQAVAVSLEESYAVPASKPSDKSGYIYLVVEPKKYTGGTFTVVTDKGMYEYTTTAELDLSNVYAPVSVPIKLMNEKRVSTYLFYDNFSKAQGHYQTFNAETGNNGYTIENTVQTAHGALSIGEENTTNGKLTTPALSEMIGSFEGTKDIKVSFYANGFVTTNTLQVIANNAGTITDGDNIVPSSKGLPNTDGDDRYSMDKSVLTTVIVNGVTAETTLTFTNGSSDASGKRRFVIDDLAIEEYIAPAPSLAVAYTLDMTAKSGKGNWNLTSTGLYANNGITWTITKGAPNNKTPKGGALGTNDGNKGVCKLIDDNAWLGAKDNVGPIDYSYVGTPCGYSGSQTQIAAAISEKTMANIQKVIVYNDQGSNNPEHISLVYSTNGTTYTLIGTQPYSASGNGNNTWEFEPIQNAYYAIVVEYGKETGYMYTDCLKADFYAEQ